MTDTVTATPPPKWEHDDRYISRDGADCIALMALIEDEPRWLAELLAEANLAHAFAAAARDVVAAPTNRLLDALESVVDAYDRSQVRP